jgi:hypothetical protein
VRAPYVDESCFDELQRATHLGRAQWRQAMIEMSVGGSTRGPRQMRKVHLGGKLGWTTPPSRFMSNLDEEGKPYCDGDDFTITYAPCTRSICRRRSFLADSPLWDRRQL